MGILPQIISDFLDCRKPFLDFWKRPWLDVCRKAFLRFLMGRMGIIDMDMQYSLDSQCE